MSDNYAKAGQIYTNQNNGHKLICIKDETEGKWGEFYDCVSEKIFGGAEVNLIKFCENPLIERTRTTVGYVRASRSKEADTDNGLDYIAGIYCYSQVFDNLEDAEEDADLDDKDETIFEIESVVKIREIARDEG